MRHGLNFSLTNAVQGYCIYIPGPLKVVFICNSIQFHSILRCDILNVVVIEVIGILGTGLIEKCLILLLNHPNNPPPPQELTSVNLIVHKILIYQSYQASIAKNGSELSSHAGSILYLFLQKTIHLPFLSTHLNELDS